MSDANLDKANSPDTPVELLIELSTDKDEYVRRAVAGTSRTPIEILKFLIEDKSKIVRTGVLENPNTPDQLFDEPNFNLLETLIDAESRGSGLAANLREIFQNFDTKQAEENHLKVQSYLAEMKAELEQILTDYDEDEIQGAFDDDFVSEWKWKLFDSEFRPSDTSGETFQMIFDELSLSYQSSGAFGNAELLEYCFGWTNEMNLWGFLLSPYVPRNILKSMIGWNATSNNYMSSIAVSPALSKRILHFVADAIIPIGGSYWIGLALMINANSDLYVLDSLCRYGGDGIASSYCEFPTSGGGDGEDFGVCGPLVGKSWFAWADVFNDWSEEDLTGLIDDDAPDVLKNLTAIASMYLNTPQGRGENSRDLLASSDMFGNLLVCFRMIDEFKFGRAKLDKEVNSDSSLIRSVLYWKPGMDSETLNALALKGLAFPEEVGILLKEGWNGDLSLIY
jgi:hypothetical protein